MAGPNIYDVARQRSKQRIGTEVQEQQAAIKRRFAKLGGFSSGAQMKLEQQAQEQGAVRAAQDEEGIGAQQAQADEQKAEIEKQRTFAREERLGSQEFAKGERLSGQEFARAERGESQSFVNSQRIAGEAFAGAQNQAQRDWAQNQFDQQMDFQKAAQEIAKSQFAEQFALAMKQFGLDVETTDFNKKMAENSKEGQLGKFRAGLSGKLTTKGISTGAGDIFGR